MPAVADWIAIRGEWISLVIVAAVLALSVRPLSRLLALPREGVGDLFWNAGLAFVVAGRLSYVVLESPEALTDPLVLIRIQGGIEPFVGVAAVAAVLVWRTRNVEGGAAALMPWVAVASAGLALTAISYDLACVARDGCTGAEAPAPLGFAMSDLTETRFATPLVEAALLLLAGGVLLSSNVPTARGLIALGGLTALVRVAFTPLSVLGTDALGVESVLFALVGLAALVVAARGGFAVEATGVAAGETDRAEIR